MYSKIANILNEYFQERWFLDSGSLLGVIRDGKFLASDSGIDISILIDDYHSPSFGNCIKRIESLGFAVSRFQWNGITYKYCLVPLKSCEMKYALDFHLFKKFEGNYCCPQIRFEPSKLKLINFIRGVRRGVRYRPMNGVLGFFRNSFFLFYRDVVRYFGRPMNMNNCSAHIDSNYYKWFIPVSLLHGISKETFNGLNILNDCNDYLTFRYGDWKTPVSDWVTLRDDGGIAKSSVEEINKLVN